MDIPASGHKAESSETGPIHRRRSAGERRGASGNSRIVAVEVANPRVNSANLLQNRAYVLIMTTMQRLQGEVGRVATFLAASRL